MALKFRITKASFEKLSDEIKDEYKADGDSHYTLDVSGLEDTSALKRAKERAEIERDEYKTELDEATTKLADFEKNQTKEDRDINRLTTKFERKLADKDEEITTLKSNYEGFISKTLIERDAITLAGEISTAPKLMAKEVRDRLTVDFSGDEPVVVIKSVDGKADPNLKMEDLRKELLDNKDLAPILRGNMARGSAGQNRATPAPGDAPASETPRDVNKLPASDFMASIEARRAAAGKPTYAKTAE